MTDGAVDGGTDGAVDDGGEDAANRPTGGGGRDPNPADPGYPWTPPALAAIRGRRRRRWVALLAAAVVGFGAAWIHWLGLFIAGALLGLPSRTPGRAVLAGVAFGVVVVAAQVFLLPDTGAGGFLAFRPPVYVTLGAALGAPAWGSLIRGVV